MTKKSGLRIDTTLRIVRTMCDRIDSIVACVVADERTHGWMLARMQAQVWMTPEYAKLPCWGQRGISSYFHGKADMLGRYLVLFAYKYEGKLYRTRQSVPKVAWPTWDELQVKHHQEKGLFVPEDCDEHGNYWPSGKPYSVSVTELGRAKLAASEAV